MPINRSIPGQLREQEAQAIEALSALVPENGTVVEVGSLLGLSSWIWAKSVDPSVTVHCVDPWEIAGGSNFNKLARDNAQSFSLDQFKKNVADCRNIVAMQGYSPDDFGDWNKKIDLYFEDAVHTDPILSRNLDFWSSRLKRTGILCGHDYHDQFPDVRAGAARLAKKTRRRLRLIGSLWILLPREIESSSNPRTIEILQRLDALERLRHDAPRRQPGERADAYAKRRVRDIESFSYRLDFEGVAPRVTRGEDLVLKGMLTNTSDSDWPVIMNDAPYLLMGAELWSSDGRKVATDRCHVHRPVLTPGMAVPFTVALATDRAVPGEATVRISPLYTMITWFQDRGASVTELTVDITARDGT